MAVKQGSTVVPILEYNLLTKVTFQTREEVVYKSTEMMFLKYLCSLWSAVPGLSSCFLLPSMLPSSGTSSSVVGAVKPCCVVCVCVCVCTCVHVYLHVCEVCVCVCVCEDVRMCVSV